MIRRIDRRWRQSAFFEDSKSESNRSSRTWEEEGMDFTEQQAKEEVLMKELLTLFGIVGIFSSLCPQHMFLIAGDSQTSKPPSELSESEARKILIDSPWAKRSKLRSTTKAATYIQPVESPGTALEGLGRGGPGHGVVAPSAADIINQSAGPQVMTCLGWGIGIGSFSLPSPTSEECKAAWQSVAAVKSAGLSNDSVIISWESAAPLREARVRLAIKAPPNARASDAVIIQMIAHPLLRQINTTAVSMRQMIRESAVLLRNGQNRVQASDVAFIETNETIVRFFFPRQQTIQPGDKQVIFRFEMLDSLVEAKFNLKEMVYHGEPAL